MLNIRTWSRFLLLYFVNRMLNQQDESKLIFLDKGLDLGLNAEYVL